jgi:tetratricopeptide (TPR) repeat protein
MALNKDTRRRKALVSCLCLSSLILLTFHAPQGSAQTHTIKMPIKKPEAKAPAPAIPVDYESQMREVNHLIQLNDRNADALFRRGWLYHMAGKLQLALQDYTKALQINTRHAGAYYNRGLVSVMLKQYEPALKDFSEVIKLQPRAVDAYCNRGNAYLRSGETDLALRDFNAALKIKPDDPDLLYNRGMAYAAMGEQPKASADMKKAARAGHAKAKEYLEESP